MFVIFDSQTTNTKVTVIERSKDDYCVAVTHYDMPNRGLRTFDYKDQQQALQRADDIVKCYK